MGAALNRLISRDAELAEARRDRHESIYDLLRKIFVRAEADYRSSVDLEAWMNQPHGSFGIPQQAIEAGFGYTVITTVHGAASILVMRCMAVAQAEFVCRVPTTMTIADPVDGLLTPVFWP